MLVSDYRIGVAYVHVNIASAAGFHIFGTKSVQVWGPLVRVRDSHMCGSFKGMFGGCQRGWYIGTGISLNQTMLVRVRHILFAINLTAS